MENKLIKVSELQDLYAVYTEAQTCGNIYLDNLRINAFLPKETIDKFRKTMVFWIYEYVKEKEKELAELLGGI